MNVSFSFWDAAIAIAIVFFTWKGWKEGFIDNLIGFFSFMIILFFAIQHMAWLADQIYTVFQVDRVFLTFLAFSIILGGGWFIIRSFVKKLQVGINPSEKWKNMDHFVGGVLGFIQGGILISLIAMIIMLSPFAGPLERQRNRSVLLRPAIRMAPTIFEAFTLIFPGAKNFREELVKSIGREPYDAQTEEVLNELKGSYNRSYNQSSPSRNSRYGSQSGRKGRPRR